MADRPNTVDLQALFLNDIAMMDVRAPIEYQQGAFPNTVNLPLMVDDERQKVGTCYKQNGQEAAIALGHKLVSGDIKEQRIAQWRYFVAQHPEGYLYCFRGGLRSRVTQQWLAEAGIDYPYVVGGYKAMRRYLIDFIDQQAEQRPFVIISGRTGSGKTKVIEAEAASIDLEGLANHRGSSFGRHVTAQPSQINFENALAVSMLKLQQRFPAGALMLEDESVSIGSAHIPHNLYAAMKAAPLVILEEPLENRIATVIGDYVDDLSAEYQQVHGEEQGWQYYTEYMLAAMDRIRKRLGAERHGDIKALMVEAFQRQQHSADQSGHEAWITRLLADYYDPMYDYQLSKKDQRILFKGNQQAVLDWFANYRQQPAD